MVFRKTFADYHIVEIVVGFVSWRKQISPIIDAQNIVQSVHQAPGACLSSIQEMLSS